jgi:hypothetical protein
MNLWTLVLGVACAGAAIGTPAVADDGAVTLSATGAEGVRVRGRCVLEAPDGEREVRLDEAVPFERRWEEAAGLRCELEASGPATLEAASGGSRSRAATSGGRLVVTLR